MSITNGVTSAEGSVEFAGRTVKIYPLNLKRIGRLNNFFRGLMISAARASFDETTTEGQMRASLDSAVRESLGVHFHSKIGTELLSSPEGCCELVHVCTDLSREESYDFVTDASARTAFLAEFTALNGEEGSGEEGGGEKGGTIEAEQTENPTQGEVSTLRAS